jgi:hypothetical protein
LPVGWKIAAGLGLQIVAELANLAAAYAAHNYWIKQSKVEDKEEKLVNEKHSPNV